MRVLFLCRIRQHERVLARQAGRRGTYTSPPGRSMCVCIDRVEETITHPTLLKLESRAHGHALIFL